MLQNYNFKEVHKIRLINEDADRLSKNLYSNQKDCIGVR